MTSETPRAASAEVAAATSSLSLSCTSSSEKRWLRNLPVVLLSLIASCAPAIPLFSGGMSMSEMLVFGCGPRR